MWSQLRQATKTQQSINQQVGSVKQLISHIKSCSKSQSGKRKLLSSLLIKNM